MHLAVTRIRKLGNFEQGTKMYPWRNENSTVLASTVLPRCHPEKSPTAKGSVLNTKGSTKGSVLNIDTIGFHHLASASAAAGTANSTRASKHRSATPRRSIPASSWSARATAPVWPPSSRRLSLTLQTFLHKGVVKGSL